MSFNKITNSSIRLPKAVGNDNRYLVMLKMRTLDQIWGIEMKNIVPSLIT